MDFEKEYRIEQDRIKHNISLDRMILEKCEKKAPKHNISLGKIYAIAGLVADEDLNEDNILPEAFDPRVAEVVSRAIKDHIH